MGNGVRFNETYPEIAESNELYERAAGLIPGHSQTLAKGPGQYVNGVAPKYLVRGKGAHVWDVDGNEYIDYNMGIGPLSLGYCYGAVDEAIRRQLNDGITFSMMHPLEVEVAELIREVIPNAEMVRFSKTGADVTSAAIRLARAYTGRPNVVCCGYHGWHDWYIAVTDRNKGILQEVRDHTFTIQYNDFDSVLEAIDDDTACVILEPAVFDVPENNFLHRLKDLCRQKGALLVFDEMWTGFRLALGGAQEYFGIKADLATFSKAIANGMPLSVLTGKADIMKLLEKDVFFYTTFGGEALSLAAAKATIEEMKSQRVVEYIKHQGKKLRHGVNAIAKGIGMDYVSCVGFDCRSLVTFSQSAGQPLEMKSLVQQEMFKRGILWSGFHTISFSHTDEDIDYTLLAYREAFSILQEAVNTGNVAASLRGSVVEPVFRKTGNFNMKPKKSAQSV
ncbi:MAG TPA: aminotransferase class III-fold pyridoxal phosphate-dependent enzyme [Bacteroidota bacterium]|nr:aminotransferase class III-fold pyridoxal phosphate-dependent enzyme [Bacteroidota bacterium]